MQTSVRLTRDYMNIYRAPAADGTRALLLVVLLQVIDGTAISLTFTHHSILNRQLPIAEARGYLAFLKAEAAAGTQMWLLIERAGMWTSAAAVADQAEQDMIDGIAANLDHTEQRLNETVDVSDILDGITRTGGWRGARKANQPRIRPTRTNTHLKPPTPAQLDRMRQHHNGVVTCGYGQPWTLLDGIVQRGHADRASVMYWPGTRKIRSVRLNGRGWAAIGQTGQVAA